MSLERLAEIAAQLAALCVLPFVLLGVINRTKALWAGRRGQPILQSLFDVLRLLKKAPVYAEVTTPVFRAGPWILLGSTLASGLIAPVLGERAPVSFAYDFVAVAYVWGLGRIFLMLAALDTGSAFEGMGAAREATFGAFIEPALLLTLGTLAASAGLPSFAAILDVGLGSADRVVVSGAAVVVLLIVLQIESARVPVDDPNTHLELTMIHEVMVLDHSGPDLAAIQYGAAMKLTVCASLVATLLNPVSRGGSFWGLAAVNLALTLAVGIAIACVESLVARLKLRAVPQYILVATVAAFVVLLTAIWQQEGA